LMRDMLHGRSAQEFPVLQKRSLQHHALSMICSVPNAVQPTPGCNV
jgi:hypothetical protein